jgi:hypothetical protein
MTFKCKDNKIVRNITWIYRKDAWIPVITVCTYKLYPITNVIKLVDDIPDVTGLNLEFENLGLIISWINNLSYFTEISIKLSEGEWNVSIIEKNQNTIIYDLQPNSTIEVKVRFIDNNDRFSKNYTTASITTWELIDFTLYGLSGTGLPDLKGNTLYNFNSENQDFTPNKIITFLEENVFEDEYALGSVPANISSIYRLVYRTRDDYSGIEFEHINLITNQVNPIPLNYSGEYTLCNGASMCFNLQNNNFFVSSNCGFFQLETNGTVTRLSSNNNTSNKGFTSNNEAYFTLYNDNGTIGLYEVDTSNGDRTTLHWANSTINQYTLTDIHSLEYYNGLFYAILSAVEPEEYDGLILITIDLVQENVSFISTLSDGYNLISSAIVNGESKLIVQNIQNNTLYFLSDSGQVGNEIINTSMCCNRERYPCIAFNPIDRNIYHASMRVEGYDQELDIEDQMELNFEKFNPNTLEITQINISGDVYIKGVLHSTTSYISDGGNNMFDTGNFLNTNIIENGFIQYTHTQQESSEFTEIADGVVADGTLYFGENSEYFTNMYSGLFVMVAKNININSFTISGDLGADGNGIVNQHSISLNGGYTGYFKKTYGTNSSSVNHLIIVPTRTGILSNIVADTNQDFHEISGLENTNHIYYLLFSTFSPYDGSEVSENLAQIIGNSFLSVIFNSNTASDALSALNANVNQITSNIENIYLFVDQNNGEQNFPVGNRPGLQNPRCMVYKNNNSFLIVGNNGGFYSINKNGVINYLNNAWHFYDCSSLAFIENRLYAGYDSVANIAELDPNTGEIINEVQDKKGPIVWVDNNSINHYSTKSMAAVGNDLYIISYDGNQNYTLAVIDNLQPDEFNIIYATSIRTFKIVGGLVAELFGKERPEGAWYWSYDETTTLIEVGPTSEEPNKENLEVQWNSDGNADQSYIGWENVNVLEVIQQDTEWWWVIVDKPTSNFKLRMRYKNPISKWTYYTWD